MEQPAVGRGRRRAPGGLLVALLALAPTAPGTAAQLREAPDGRRGLGGEASCAELRRLLRSDRAEDRELLDGLAELEPAIEERVVEAERAARAAGWMVLVPGGSGDLDALQAAFAAALREPRAALNRPGPPGRAFAHMALDARFRARAELLQGWREDAREVRAGLAVLRAAEESWVVLEEGEAAGLAARVDLAASRLRALRADLTALRPPDGGAGVGLDRVESLVELARGDRAAWSAGWSEVAGRVERELEALRGALFTTRLAPRLEDGLQVRARRRAEAARAREIARLYLPGTPEAERAPPEVRELSTSRRLRIAWMQARTGLAVDPLDEELCWIAAHAGDFHWGTPESRPLYDRYLALRGIRAHRHETIEGRDLTPREEEALAALAR